VDYKFSDDVLELKIYYEDFGTGAADNCVAAEDDGNAGHLKEQGYRREGRNIPENMQISLHCFL